jgi:hypothetical protein
MNMVSIFAAALVTQLHFASFFHRVSVPAPTTSCRIDTVSYKFVGAPGTEFVYEGKKYSIPDTGAIELLADKKVEDFVVAGQRTRLDLFPKDAFGTRTVTLAPIVASK